MSSDNFKPLAGLGVGIADSEVEDMTDMLDSPDKANNTRGFICPYSTENTSIHKSFTVDTSTIDVSRDEARLAQMLAAESTKEGMKSLKVEAAAPPTYLGTIKSMDRSRFKSMMGLAARTTDRVLADLFKLGIVSCKTPKGAIKLALPLPLFRYLFPRLWHEAEGVM